MASPKFLVVDDSLTMRRIVTNTLKAIGFENIAEAADGKIPKASNQLHSVTQAAESATVEILDVLDRISRDVVVAENGLQALQAMILETAGDVREAVKLLQQTPCAEPGHAGAREALTAPLRTGRSDAAQGIVDTITAVMAKTKESSMNIAVALQVQDVTSQQIAGVSHMIESVRLELTRILERIGNCGLPPGSQAEAPPTCFDTDARYAANTERQEQADTIIRQWTSTSHD